MTEGAIERKRKLSIRTKLAFASGSLEEAMVLAANVATLAIIDTLEPGPGETAFMLVSGIVLGTESGLGEDSSGQPRPNDNPCP